MSHRFSQLLVLIGCVSVVSFLTSKFPFTLKRPANIFALRTVTSTTYSEMFGIGKQFETVPETIYRFANNYKKFKATLPEMLVNDFDHIAVDANGLILPRELSYRGTVGVEFNQMSESFEWFLNELSSRSRVTVLSEGTVIPDSLRLIRTSQFGYSLQPKYPCTLVNFNKYLNKFLKTLRVINRDIYWAEKGSVTLQGTESK